MKIQSPNNLPQNPIPQRSQQSEKPPAPPQDEFNKSEPPQPELPKLSAAKQVATLSGAAGLVTVLASYALHSQGLFLAGAGLASVGMGAWVVSKFQH